MSTMASDLNNTAFTGAMNPDDALWVEFYDSTVLETFKSEQAGRPIYSDVVMTKIRIPGNETLVIDRPMEPHDKIRFPRQWAFYQNKTHDDAGMVGTPISELPGLSKAVVENLRIAGFRTIEQGAAASDGALQGLHMAAGMAPQAFRLRCQQYLNAAADNAPMTQMAAELEKRDIEVAALQAQVKAMAEMMEKLAAAKPDVPVVPEKPNLPPPRAGVIPPKKPPEAADSAAA